MSMTEWKVMMLITALPSQGQGWGMVRNYLWGSFTKKVLLMNGLFFFSENSGHMPANPKISFPVWTPVQTQLKQCFSKQVLWPQKYISSLYLVRINRLLGYFDHLYFLNTMFFYIKENTSKYCICCWNEINLPGNDRIENCCHKYSYSHGVKINIAHLPSPAVSHACHCF